MGSKLSPSSSLADLSPLSAPAHTSSYYLRHFCALAALSQLFFGIRKPFLSLLDILVLLPTVFALTNVANKVDGRTFWLLAPYCAWTTLATYLNGE